MSDTHSASDIARKSLAVLAISAERLIPIKVAENAIYLVPEHHLIVRIARPGQARVARREVEIANWLHTNNIPAVEPAGTGADFLEIDGRPVTLWRELPAHRPATEAEIAAALSKLHALPTPAFLSTIEPFVRLEERIDAGHSLSTADRAWLREHLTELREDWGELSVGMPWGPVHGDAWEGNVVTTDAGVTTFLDLERASVGPPEWDLTSTAIKHSSFGWISAHRYATFWHEYGYDVTTWTGFELLRDIRELRMTCMAAQSAGTNSDHVHQAQHRVDCLRGRSGPRPWVDWIALP
ncbi:phosphotransferase enzyme family protein [Nocardia salmonicida]|uniref:phosphotransferase enzyme family protein n=1 Tax=Nocardia salmonicida TaxID=53431 RepID=UPI00343FBE6F